MRADGKSAGQCYKHGHPTDSSSPGYLSALVALLGCSLLALVSRPLHLRWPHLRYKVTATTTQIVIESSGLSSPLNTDSYTDVSVEKLVERTSAAIQRDVRSRRPPHKAQINPISVALTAPTGQLGASRRGLRRFRDTARLSFYRSTHGTKGQIQTVVSTRRKRAVRVQFMSSGLTRFQAACREPANHIYECSSY